MGSKNKIDTLWNVLRKPKYFLIAISVSFLFYSLNPVIKNWRFLISTFSSSGFIKTINLFTNLTIGFGNTIKESSHISIILVSILFGVLLSLIFYKIKIIKSEDKKIGIIASIGIFIGALSPGCAACGVGLLAIFGVSAATLSLLPFAGLEISIIAIIILTYSINKILEKIKNGNICNIK